ncbi:MAG: peptidase domain-containing ABC transporter [Bacilli bacterium]|nr:peptidase domain-containing ABC transporter [Bacilli bacterium]
MFKKYPFIKQYDQQECAAAATWMVVKYYRGHINISKLATMLKTTKEGTNAYNIVQTLNSLGFEAKGIKEKKLENTKNPFIAHVIINNIYKHYLVVYEINNNYILIADPADKIKKISHKEFYQMWTGIKIIMHPIRPIVKEQDVSIFLFLKNLLFPYKHQILKIGLISLSITALSIIGSFFFQTLIDNMKSIKNTCIFFIIILITNLLITYYRNMFLTKFTYKLDQKISNITFKHLLNLPYLYYHNHTTGDVVSRINDLSLLKKLIGKTIITIFIDLPLSIFTALVLCSINKLLFLIVSFVLVSYALVIIITHKKTNYYINQTQNQKSEVNSYLVEAISGFETVKGLNIETKIKINLKDKYRKYIGGNLKLDCLIIKISTLKDLLNIIGQVTVTILGITFVQNQILKLGELITFITLSNLFLQPVRNIIDLDIEIKESANALKRVLELLIIQKNEPTKKLKGDIKFKNVSCSLDEVTNIIKDINLKIKEGSKVLLTGSSGSGKSTLLKVLKGYYPYEGKIFVGSAPLEKVNNIIYTSHKDILFTGTIKDNLTIKDNKGLKKNIYICKLDELINSLDLGLNFLIEENGINLSSGQKQRISLARALRKFDILLIDEGLNSLNQQLERSVLINLFKAYKNKTIIVVSHHLDNKDLFDQFIKMENGKIIINKKKGEV